MSAGPHRPFVSVKFSPVGRTYSFLIPELAFDSDGDGQIGPEELIEYEWELAPDIQLSARLKRRPSEAAPAKATPDGQQLAKHLVANKFGTNKQDAVRLYSEHPFILT